MLVTVVSFVQEQEEDKTRLQHPSLPPYLPALSKADAVWGSPLQYCDSVHPQCSLVHIHTRHLRQLGALRGGGEGGIHNFSNWRSRSF